MNWPTKKIGEVCNIVYGFAFKANAFNETGKGLPVIRIGDVDKGKTDKFFDGKYNDKYLVKKGDILLGLSGSFKAFRWEGNIALLNQRVATLKTFENDIVESFVFYQMPKLFMQFEKIITQLSVKNILTKHLENLRVLYPPLETQKQIVERMDKIAEAQKLNDELTQKSNELFQSLLHKELNPVGKIWEVRKLSEIIDINYGKGLDKSYRKENGKYYAYGSNGPVYRTDKILIEELTIIVGRKGGAGLLWMTKEPSWPIDTTFYLRVKDGHNTDLNFLYFSLQTKKLPKLAIVTAVPGINRSTLYNVKIFLPPLKIQKQIVEKLSAALEYKNKLLAQKSKLKELFDSVLHKSMKGEMDL